MKIRFDWYTYQLCWLNRSTVRLVTANPFFKFYVNISFSMKKMKKKIHDGYPVLFSNLHMCANFHHNRTINKDFFFGLGLRSSQVYFYLLIHLLSSFTSSLYLRFQILLHCIHWCDYHKQSSFVSCCIKKISTICCLLINILASSECILSLHCRNSNHIVRFWFIVHISLKYNHQLKI